MSPRGAWVVGAALVALACGGCRRGARAPSDTRDGRAPGTYETDLSIAPPPPGAGVLELPYQPRGCAYSIAGVVPNRARIAPHAELYGPAPEVRNLHLTFVGDPRDSVVVQWSTDAATLASEVAFGREGTALDGVAQGYSFSYAGGGPRRQHEVHVCGLAPGTRYRYRAGGARVRSGEFAFTTAPGPGATVRLMVAGDTRNDPATWGAIATRALEERPDALLFSGDAVADGGNQRQWDAFFAAAPEFFASTPALWADGNHEGESEVYYAQFALPENGDRRYHEHWYSVAYGPLRVVVLNDTNVGDATVRGLERAFLERALAGVDRGQTPFVATLHHKPQWTLSDGHVSDLVTRAAWGPLFDRYHVDLDLAGHVHNYESSLPLREGAITDDAHGTRYINFGGGGAPLYGLRARQPWVLGRERTHGFGILAVSPGGFVWDARRADGSAIEVITVARGPMAPGAE